MTTYSIQFQGRRSEIDADDAEHAARRAVLVQLAEERIPRGASYQVSVSGEAWIVDVAVEMGRGAVTARRA